MSHSNPTILFVCTGNSIRSQMAEAYYAHFSNDRELAFSAGVLPGFVHPLTVNVLEEDGIDWKLANSKGIGEIPTDRVDQVITLCPYAHSKLPIKLLSENLKIIHHPVQDPTANYFASDMSELDRFRTTRDTIRTFVRKLLKS